MWPSVGPSAAALNACVPTASQAVTYVSGGPDEGALPLAGVAPIPAIDMAITTAPITPSFLIERSLPHSRRPAATAIPAIPIENDGPGDREPAASHNARFSERRQRRPCPVPPGRPLPPRQRHHCTSNIRWTRGPQAQTARRCRATRLRPLSFSAATSSVSEAPVGERGVGVAARRRGRPRCVGGRAVEPGRGGGLGDAVDFDERAAGDVVLVGPGFGHGEHRREADLVAAHDLDPLVAGAWP